MARRTHLFIGGLLVLAAGGCDGEKRVDLGQMKLVFDACWNVGGTDDGEASCGAALRRRTDDRVPVCVAFHSSLGGQVAPMWRDVDAGRFVPAGPPRELKLDPGGEEVIVKVFFLAGGADPETACTVEAFTVETRCEVAAGCLLASDGARVAVGSGAPALEWGGEDRPCQFECGDPAFCGVAGAWAQETCNGVDDDCDGEVDEGELNVCGECGPDPEEVCNGEDDDCDGQTDEGAPGDGEPCDTGEPGVCASGIGDCTAGVFT